MKFFGLFAGLAFGVLSGLLFHMMVLGTTNFSFFSFLVPLVNTVATVLSAVIPSLPALPTTILMFLLWFLFNYLITAVFYRFGNSSYTMAEMSAGWNASNTTPITDANNIYRFPRWSSEQFAFGFFLGTATATNFVIWLLVTSVTATIAVAPLALLPILVIFSSLAQSRIIQTLIGWTTWTMPLAWIPGVIGLLAFIPFAGFGLAQHGRDALRIDPSSGTLETQVDFSSIPLVSPLAIGFSLGFFTFLNTNLTSPKSFLTPSVSAHESGHTLNTGAFGGVFLLFNAVDENVFRTPTDSYYSLGELYAESRAAGSQSVASTPDFINPYLPHWGQ